MLRGTIDRIEGDVVVLMLSDGNQLLVKRHHLPEQVREGSVLDVTFTLNEEEEAEQRRKVEDLQQRLTEKGKKEPEEA
jgi:hypothetical protein